MVLDGSRPAKVPDAVIDDLKKRERNGLIELPAAAPACDFAFGDPVKIRSGPLVGLSGLFAGMAPHDRVCILLDLLGKRRSVTLPARDVVSSRK